MRKCSNNSKIQVYFTFDLIYQTFSGSNVSMHFDSTSLHWLNSSSQEAFCKLFKTFAWMFFPFPPEKLIELSIYIFIIYSWLHAQGHFFHFSPQVVHGIDVRPCHCFHFVIFVANLFGGMLHILFLLENSFTTKFDLSGLFWLLLLRYF